MSIPADHITFDGDTAWMVLPPFDPETEMAEDDPRSLDRPCHTCGGEMLVVDPHEPTSSVDCPDCIDGRHTFDIEVEQGSYTESWGSRVVYPRIYRVSIVPGMVLPIIDTLPESGYQVEGQRAVFNDPAWPGESFIRNIRGDIDGIVALPPAAAPGMFAVQLNVEPKEQP